MDNQTAKVLLERYFAGETTLAEEAQLRSFFEQDDLPAEFETYQPLFQYFGQAAQQVPSEKLNQRLKSRPKAKIRSLGNWRSWAAAAVVVLGLGTWWMQPLSPTPSQETAINWSQYEIQDEEEAMRVITAAFRKSSSALQKSVQTAEQEMKAIGKLSSPF